MPSTTEPRYFQRPSFVLGLAAATLMAVGALTSCGSQPVESGTTVTVEPPAAGEPGIVLPAGSEVRLASAPGPSTREGATWGVVYALVSIGLVVEATATAVRTVELPDGGGKAAETTLRIDKTYLGSTEIREVKVLAAEPQVAMEPGTRFVLFLGEAMEIPGAYNLIEWNLYDFDNGRWVGRFDSTQPYADRFEPLVLDDQDFQEIVADGRAILGRREAAARATMTAEAGAEADQVVIGGYASGETVELRICDVGGEFTPLSARSCDREHTGTITPDGPSFTVTYVEPDELALEDGSKVRCETARCALVAYDAGWPARVWASFEA